MHRTLIAKITEIISLTASDEQQIERLFKQKAFDKKKLYLRVGDQSLSIGFLLCGVMRSFYISEDGNEYTKYIAQTGDFIFNVSSFMQSTPSLFYIEALTDCVILEINKRDYNHLTQADTKYSTLFTGMLMKSYLVKEAREADFLLLSAARRYEKYIKENPGIEEIVSQKIIASYLGIAPESLSRIKKLNKDQ
jgi:CRP-like cAMP-binding protein